MAIKQDIINGYIRQAYSNKIASLYGYYNHDDKNDIAFVANTDDNHRLVINIEIGDNDYHAIINYFDADSGTDKVLKSYRTGDIIELLSYTSTVIDSIINLFIKSA